MSVRQQTSVQIDALRDDGTPQASRSWSADRRRFAFALTLPLAAVLLALLVYPLLDTLMLAFTDSAGRLSLAVVREVLAADGFGRVAANTALFTLFSTALSMTFGVALAWAMDQVTAGRRLFMSLLILPFAIMPVVSGLTWGMMLEPATGVVNDVASMLGLPTPGWGTATQTALATVIMIDVWQSTPFCFLIAYAGFQSLSRDPVEAALLDGAGPWQMLRFVAIPMMRNLLLIAIIFRFMDAFRAFDTIYVVTHGGPGRASETLVLRAFIDAFQFHRPRETAAIGVMLLAVAILATRKAGDLIGREIAA